MTITQRLMKPGSFTFRVHENTPWAVRSRLVEGGYLIITPARIDVDAHDDATIKKLARYSGIITAQKNRLEFRGSDLSWLLGNEQGLGPIHTFLTWNAAGGNGSDFTGFLNNYTGQLFPVHGIVEGNVRGGGPEFFEEFRLATTRHILDKVCAGLGDEWRVNPDGTVDVDKPNVLFPDYTTPKVVAVRKDGGPEQLVGLTVEQLEEEVDLADFTTTVLVAAEGEGNTMAVEILGGPTTRYRDWEGNGIDMQRIVDSPSTEEVSAADVAAAALARYEEPRRLITLSTETYDIGRFVLPGNSIYVYDPTIGLTDPTVSVPYRGETIHPVRQRLMAVTWPLERGMGIYYRDGEANYIDLSDYVVYEAEAGGVGAEVDDPPLARRLPARRTRTVQVPTKYEVGREYPALPNMQVISTSLAGPLANHLAQSRGKRRRRIGGSWRRVASQSAAGGGATTTISWDTEDFDSHGFLAHHATTGTTFTVPTGMGGLYLVTVRIRVGAAFGDTVNDYIQVVALGHAFRFSARGTQADGATATVLMPMNDGDTFQVQVRQSTAANINIIGHMFAYRLTD